MESEPIEQAEMIETSETEHSEIESLLLELIYVFLMENNETLKNPR